MKRIAFTGLAIVGILAIAGYVSISKDQISKGTSDYKDSSYEIDGRNFTIGNEIGYFGNKVSADFNRDGFIDEAFLITRDGGGSGTFYYVVVALNSDNGYRGTNGIFLGDRIAPQTTEFRNGEIIVNYAERRAAEPMTTRPSVGVSKYLKLESTRLVEIKK